MTLDQFFKVIEESEASDWTSIGRPVFAQDMQQVSGGGQTVPWVEIDEHHSLMSFRKDLSISIATGLTHREEFLKTGHKRFQTNTHRRTGSTFAITESRFFVRYEYLLTAAVPAFLARLRVQWRCRSGNIKSIG